MKKSHILIVIFLLGSTLMSAQEKEKKSKKFASGFSLTAQVQLGLPQNDFQEIMNGYPVGASFSFGTRLGRLGLFRIGGEYAWNTLNHKKTTVELLDDAQNVFVGDLEKTTNVIHYQGYIRLMPFKRGFRPYADIILGARSYASETHIEVEYSDGSYAEREVVTDRDFLMTYGFAGGLEVALGKNVFIDGRVQVLRGGNVSYVDDGSLQVDTNGEIDYSLQLAPTDMVIPALGLSVFF